MAYWEKETDYFVFFHGGILSNHYRCKFHSNFSADEDIIPFSSSEQYMMAAKAKLFNDEENYENIMSTDDPKVCKALGRQVKSFDDKIWLANARDLIYVGIYDKFYQNDNLFSILMSSDNKTLVEAAPNDCLWGIGLHNSDFRCSSPNRWPGKNWLGEVIMKVREDLRNDENNSFEKITWK